MVNWFSARFSAASMAASASVRGRCSSAAASARRPDPVCSIFFMLPFLLVCASPHKGGCRAFWPAGRLRGAVRPFRRLHSIMQQWDAGTAPRAGRPLRPATTPRWSGTAAAAARGAQAPPFSHSLTRSSLLCVNCIFFLRRGADAGPSPLLYRAVPVLQGGRRICVPAHARMLWVSRQATGSRSSASVRMELISIAPLPARSVNSGVPPSRA